MNARVYDPDIGRFLSADPTVPNPYNPQAYNRYAYVYNNPLGLIDKNGFEPRGPDGGFVYGEGSASLGSTSDPSGVPGSSLAADGTLKDSHVQKTAQHQQNLGLAPKSEKGSLETVKQGVGKWWEASVAGFKSESPGEAALRILQGLPGEGVVVGGISKVGGALTSFLAKLLSKGDDVAAKGIGAAEREATGFLGRAGNELKNAPYQNVRNEATKINGRDFSGHALDQMQNRGVMPSVVENALSTGTQFSTRAGTTGIYDAVNNVRVIVNSETGRVVTVIRGAP
jgi:hypothetical protein